MNETVWYSIFAGAAVKSSAVLGAAWLLTRAMRGHSAASRRLAAAAGPGDRGLVLRNQALIAASRRLALRRREARF